MNNINQLMTPNVATISPNQSVQEAAALMSEHNVGSLPVVENGQLRGIITDRDITLRTTAQGGSSHTPVSECMSSHNLVSGNPNMSVEQAAELMAQNQIRRLPIVDNNQVVGIVALGDLATNQMADHQAEVALTNISKPSSPKM